jgi:hypothetical protein
MRVHLGRQDLEPVRRQGGRDACEPPGAIVAHDAQLGRPGVPRWHARYVCGSSGESTDGSGVLHDRLGTVGEEVPFRERREERIERLGRPGPRRADGLEHARPALGIRGRVLLGKVRFSGEVKVLEHPGLPRRHRGRRGRGHVDDRQ